MEQAEKLCDSICIIARGEKVVDGRLADVKRQHGGRHVIVALEDGGDVLDRVLADRSLVAKADNYGQYAEIEMADRGDPQRVLTELLRYGARVSRFEIAEPTLNKIFIDLVGAEATEAHAEVETAHA
jgi:ABC-2 type transport system ATP-binding protein